MTLPFRHVHAGRVALVGAGPGDPDLLTRRAARVLGEADVVVYDALVAPEVLDLAPNARRIFVGKRAGRPSVRQEFINALLVRMARRGHRVVRLKGGDPFVFGRGGEEGLALAASGIPFDVVPGVSSATGAAALASIPVTHRGVASAFIVVSGHHEQAYKPVLEALPPHSVTVVVMMGMSSAPRVAALLLERGWGGATPAALLLSASTPAAVARTTSLGQLAVEGVRPAGEPGTLVIGEVVRLRSLLRAAEPALPDAAAEPLASHWT